MIFPNIQIISKKQNIYFCNTVKGPISNTRYKFLQNHIKAKEVYIIISQISNYKNVVKYLKSSNFKFVHIIIDDVFRGSMNAFLHRPIEDYTELAIAYGIIKKANIKRYKIYHCEKLEGFNPTNHTMFNNIDYMDLFLTQFCLDLDPPDSNTNFTNKISCLNNRFDFHRYFISNLLINKDKTLVTFNDLIPTKKILTNQILPLYNFQTNLQLEIRENSFIMDEKFKKNRILKVDKQHSTKPLRLIESSFVNVITETTFLNPYRYISEKSIKPMLVHRPFIMLGPQGNLQLLKDMGFKTFNKWWDESYDKEKDNVKRLEKVYEICANILDKPLSELNDMYQEMIPILKHNANQIENVPKYFLKDIFD